MGRKHRKEEASVGEDAFLDTTANLVGILIILVVIIGTKTKLEAEEYGRRQAEAETQPELDEPKREAVALAESLQKQRLKMQEYKLETEYRRRERDQLLLTVASARQSVEEDLEAVDESKRKALEDAAETEALERKIEEVEKKIGATQETPRPQVILEHLPTPMARTVFTTEMHVQLKAGKVTVIPWDRLVQTLKEQVPMAVRRKGSRDSIEDTLGPVGGFLMQYRMNAIANGFELERFELEPTSAAVSESLTEAISPNGRLRLELASRNPTETVVTVWVYRDSFAEFRKLKAFMFDHGFLSAARPLPDGVRIGASPRGTRSTAQ